MCLLTDFQFSYLAIFKIFEIAFIIVRSIFPSGGNLFYNLLHIGNTGG